MFEFLNFDEKHVVPVYNLISKYLGRIVKAKRTIQFLLHICVNHYIPKSQRNKRFLNNLKISDQSPNFLKNTARDGRFFYLVLFLKINISRRRI